MGSVPPAGIRSRELPWCLTPVQSPNMDTTLATSLMDLWNTPGVSEKLEETARVYFANSILTVNLIPALLVGALLLFCFPHCWASPSWTNSLAEEAAGQVMAQTSRSAMATELLHHPTVLRNLLMELQNLPTELRQPQIAMTPLLRTAMMPQLQTATTLQSQTATTRRQAVTTQADESVLWIFHLKQRISTLTSSRRVGLIPNHSRS